MTTELFSDSRRVTDPGASRDLRLVLAIILASLAGLVVVLLSASSGRAGSFGTDAALPVALASGHIEPSATEPRMVTSLVALSGEKNIEALTGAIARKYHISSAAMRELVDTAYREARRNGLDSLLIIAVMAVESRFNPIAQSDGGATGLMQVIPHYHSDKFATTGGESVLDPRVNIKVGARALKEYIVRGGTEVAGLQLYNGAPGDSSNAYANGVIAERQRLQGAMRRARAQMGPGLIALG
jgi:soluble lytic murein transglycosylase-like protein